jgi:hypothetical protein
MPENEVAAQVHDQPLRRDLDIQCWRWTAAGGRRNSPPEQGDHRRPTRSLPHRFGHDEAARESEMDATRM